ncbi:MAG: hydantoinase/oxoprolinase family protein, partial [Chloroflexi bacterium]|nr:hydantoinase/oxoprolinase family protein [Chloroflexota bacterium]
PDELVHGSTVATNTILTGSGARTAFVTTKGFRDLLTIGRQARAREDLYSLTPSPIQTLVPRELCFEADERVGAQGEVIRELTEEEARRVMTEVVSSGVECVAVCLLFSFLAPEHERLLKRIAEEHGLYVSASHEVLPEAREYERASTTVISSYVAPTMTRYLEHLEQAMNETAAVSLRVMLSDATTTGVQAACANAVRTVLSGPAAGVTAAFALATEHGHDRALTFDMGGTSTDVAFCAGEVALRRDVLVGGLPIATPTVDVHSVGAGGGSVAYVDEAGALRVGPESAGADPGPAAYGRGGPPTVTDAQIVLRRITRERFLGGRMEIDTEAARAAIEQLAAEIESDVESAAAAVIDVANAEMERAVRRVTVERGHDPRDAAMVAFGGAGPLHACELATAFGITRVLVPPHPGLLSALGLVIADEAVDAVLPVYEETRGETERGLATRLEARIALAAGDLGRRIGGAEREPVTQLFVSMKYPGQAHELLLTAPSLDLAALCLSFDEVHRQRFGHADAESPVEITTVRVRVSVPAERGVKVSARPRATASAEPTSVWADGGWREGHRYARDDLGVGAEVVGPAVIHQMDATTLVPPGWHLRVADDTSLLLERL